MAKLSQLNLFIDLEKKKLSSAKESYEHAQKYQNEQQKRLSDLENYRLQYLREIKTKVSSGSKVNELIQYQNFVAKLDKACEQQITIINQAVLVAAQRKQQFLEQQKRIDAVTKYYAKRQKSEQLSAERASQKELDELANQQSRIYRTTLF